MSMSRSRVRLGILLVLVVSAMLLPVAAAPPFPIELPPLIQTDPMPGVGTMAYRFTTPVQGDVAMSIEFEFADMSVLGTGFWIYDTDFDLLLGGMGVGGWGSRGLEYHVEAPEPIGVVYDAQGTAEGGSGASILQVFGMPAGQYIVFMGMVGDGEFVSGAAALYGPEGTDLISKSGAVGGFMHLETDFGGINVLADVAGLRTKAIVGAAVEETVEHPWFGEFGYFGELEIARLTLEGPEGSQTDTSHLMLLAPPGDYRFVTDLDLGIGNLYAWGVEANFPPPALPGTGA
jgi:hypothetical protein